MFAWWIPRLIETSSDSRLDRSITIGAAGCFPLRGIKDSPPYLHDDRLITLEDTVEFFNLVLEWKLNEQEKKDLVAFMRVL